MNYKYQVNFEKVFLTGPFAGRRYSGNYLRFADWQSAEDYRLRDGEVFTACDGSGGTYRKEDSVLTAIE